MQKQKKSRIDKNTFDEYKEYLEQQRGLQSHFNDEVNRFSIALGKDYKYDECYLQQVQSSKHKLAKEQLNQSMMSNQTNFRQGALNLNAIKNSPRFTKQNTLENVKMKPVSKKDTEKREMSELARGMYRDSIPVQKDQKMNIPPLDLGKLDNISNIDEQKPKSFYNGKSLG